MDSKIWIAFGHWYLLVLDVFLILGVYFFFRLPKEMRANSNYWLPFLILCFIFLYNNFAGYTNYNFEFKKAVNAYLGNTEFPKFNLWLYNITRRQIQVVLYLFLVKSWLEPSKRKYINWMIYAFIFLALLLQISGFELMYLQQPIIYSIGANMILIACGLYFIGMITTDNYLNSNPIRLVSFWATTLLLFDYSITYIYTVSLFYLYQVNPTFGASLGGVVNVINLINTSALLLLIASPYLSKVFDKEPFFKLNY